MPVIDKISDFLSEMVEWRHHVHANPELSYQEFSTAKFVAEKLRMAQAVGELTEQGSPALEAAIPSLSQLLKAETAEREVRSTAYQLKTARFPAYRDLNGLDFTSSEINEHSLTI